MQGTRLFSGKHGFITLRDLFRWAGRDPSNYQELAEDGFMLLGERVRKPEERALVKSIIEKNLKVLFYLFNSINGVVKDCPLSTFR